MSQLTNPDDVLIAPPTRTITWTGEERIRVLRWQWWRRVRRVWTLRALPYLQLVELEESLGTLGRVGYAERLALILDAHGLRGTAQIPLETAMALEAAHFEVSYPPKAKAQASPSDEAHSSGESAPGTDGPSSTSSA